MTEFAFFFTDERVVNFILLFTRIGSIFVFVPFFSSQTIYPSVKGAIAFLFTIVLYPILPPIIFELSADRVLFAVLSELAFGFAMGVIVQLVFAGMQYAGEHISFAMSLSMATAMDPQSESNSTIITQFIYMFAILLTLAFDGHHLILAFLARSIESVPLGVFVFGESYLLYVIKGFGWLFVIGLVVAFPIIALSLLSDIAFGMIMKTVPSFNLLVVGLPARIFLSILVLTATMASTAVLFRAEFMRGFNALATLFN
ncbi:flagellar biosynthetic protein FliR [Campylobacterota bacterium]|nr:flagellar biosynthetic protein FliR [Campylobacterota bacterium]GHV02982.1 flagellar biosynthetic protein FliR [Campylobacterota bacterium]